MADFKTALESLARGLLHPDALEEQLDKLLEARPQYATRLLSELDEAHERGVLDNKHYARIKRQINEFRRAHPTETEVDADHDPEATVFERSAGQEADDEEKTVKKQSYISEDATEMKGGAVDPEEPTEIRTADATTSEEETEVKTIRKVDPDEPTAVNPKTMESEDVTEAVDATGKPSDSQVDFDVSMGTSGTLSSLDSDTTSTGTTAEEPQQQYTEPGHELGVGDVIKQRFKLLEVLGVGGMGKVFKGIDLLKEEARDKNPYVALKLLNEDFKSHPEAFISLQRESSRQQKLAHPNIATVYDFDRIAGRGTPVFITMELMEGQPLNTFIKKTVKKRGGLPFDEAFEIIRQLGAALQYAHERRLVHSDFKPGNAFLCNDGTVKTLDFGIARAVKNPVTGEAEKTLFDPGKLGALTPAYASLEMLEGEEPDTRDDIYALGCVAYELLTGKHPFNKLPANTAMENGLVPPPVRGLNKKQNRALRRAVAYKREDRCQTVEEYIEELEGKPTWHKNPFTIAAGILLVIGIAMINPALDYRHQKMIDGMISDITSGGPSVVPAKLEEIKALPRADQATITDEAREPIQRYYFSEIARHTDISTDNFNFPKAEEILSEAEQFYPGSLFVQQQREDIEFNRKQKVADLYQDFIAALDPQEALVDPDSINRTNVVLDIIRNQIDPQHPLLTDARPSNAYRLAANLAFENGDLQQALSFVTSGLDHAPDDPLLADLRNIIQNSIRVAELNDLLESVQDDLVTVEDYKRYENDIVELAGLRTLEESPLLTSLSSGLASVVNGELEQILNEGDHEQAQALAGELNELLSALLLSNELTQLKLAHLAGEERQNAIAEMVARDKQIIEERLAAPDINNPEWEADVLAGIRELDALKSEDPSISEDLQVLRESVANLYTERAQSTLETNRFDAADDLVNRGLRIAPELPELRETRELIASNRAEYERQLRINSMKDQFQVAVEADNISEANQIFEQLKSELPEDDSYITTLAPRELAESYRRLAERSAESEEYATALQFTEAAIELNPRDAGLQAIYEEYRAEVNIDELTQTFRSATVFTDTERLELARKVNEIERGAPGRYSDFLSQSESILAQRINSLAQTDENSAAVLADAASRIFLDSSVLVDLKNKYRLEPWPDRTLADAALRAGELSRAGSILDGALEGEYANHPEVLEYRKLLEESIQAANEAFENYLQAKEAAGSEYARLNAAKRLLYRAQGLWTDNPQFSEEEDAIDVLIAEAPDNPSRRILRRADEDLAALTDTERLSAVDDWTPIPSDRACTPDKAGYGARARAICYDFVNTGWRGPQMVVIPPGGPIAESFAIGKYEVSIADWSRYCALTGNCEPVTDRARFNDPVTGVTLAEAQQYVEWLSKRTGKTYRLPTLEEWEHAATVGGQLTAEADEFREIKSQLNCRVTLGDKILKGTGIAPVRSGRPNRWGLYNFIGNVQEWVEADQGVVARGGAFSDSISNCDIATARPHGGSADEITGFRVVLEDVG